MHLSFAQQQHLVLYCIALIPPQPGTHRVHSPIKHDATQRMNRILDNCLLCYQEDFIFRLACPCRFSQPFCVVMTGPIAGYTGLRTILWHLFLTAIARIQTQITYSLIALVHGYDTVQKKASICAKESWRAMYPLLQPRPPPISYKNERRSRRRTVVKQHSNTAAPFLTHFLTTPPQSRPTPRS